MRLSAHLLLWTFVGLLTASHEGSVVEAGRRSKSSGKGSKKGQKTKKGEKGRRRLQDTKNIGSLVAKTTTELLKELGDEYIQAQNKLKARRRRLAEVAAKKQGASDEGTKKAEFLGGNFFGGVMDNMNDIMAYLRTSMGQSSLAGLYPSGNNLGHLTSGINGIGDQALDSGYFGLLNGNRLLLPDLQQFTGRLIDNIGQYGLDTRGLLPGFSRRRLQGVATSSVAGGAAQPCSILGLNGGGVGVGGNCLPLVNAMHGGAGGFGGGGGALFSSGIGGSLTSGISGITSSGIPVTESVTKSNKVVFALFPFTSGLLSGGGLFGGSKGGCNACQTGTCPQQQQQQCIPKACQSCDANIEVATDLASGRMVANTIRGNIKEIMALLGMMVPQAGDLPDSSECDLGLGLGLLGGKLGGGGLGLGNLAGCPNNQQYINQLLQQAFPGWGQTGGRGGGFGLLGGSRRLAEQEPFVQRLKDAIHNAGSISDESQQRDAKATYTAEKQDEGLGKDSEPIEGFSAQDVTLYQNLYNAFKNSLGISSNLVAQLEVAASFFLKANAPLALPNNLNRLQNNIQAVNQHPQDVNSWNSVYQALRDLRDNLELLPLQVQLPQDQLLGLAAAAANATKFISGFGWTREKDNEGLLDVDTFLGSVHQILESLETLDGHSFLNSIGSCPICNLGGALGGIGTGGAGTGVGSGSINVGAGNFGSGSFGTGGTSGIGVGTGGIGVGTGGLGTGVGTGGVGVGTGNFGAGSFGTSGIGVGTGGVGTGGIGIWTGGLGNSVGTGGVGVGTGNFGTGNVGTSGIGIGTGGIGVGTGGLGSGVGTGGVGVGTGNFGTGSFGTSGIGVGTGGVGTGGVGTGNFGTGSFGTSGIGVGTGGGGLFTGGLPSWSFNLGDLTTGVQKTLGYTVGSQTTITLPSLSGLRLPSLLNQCEQVDCSTREAQAMQKLLTQRQGLFLQSAAELEELNRILQRIRGAFDDTVKTCTMYGATSVVSCLRDQIAVIDSTLVQATLLSDSFAQIEKIWGIDASTISSRTSGGIFAGLLPSSLTSFGGNFGGGRIGLGGRLGGLFGGNGLMGLEATEGEPVLVPHPQKVLGSNAADVTKGVRRLLQAVDGTETKTGTMSPTTSTGTMSPTTSTGTKTAPEPLSLVSELVAETLQGRIMGVLMSLMQLSVVDCSEVILVHVNIRVPMGPRRLQEQDNSTTPTPKPNDDERQRLCALQDHIIDQTGRLTARLMIQLEALKRVSRGLPETAVELSHVLEDLNACELDDPDHTAEVSTTGAATQSR